jgi:group I intron endonuclease
MKIYSIYKATNKVNGKSYIGFDSNWPNRTYGHKRESLKCNSNYKFHRAIRKYGWKAFEWEVICQSLDGKYLLNTMEGYFIQYYDTFENGYNMTLGGDGTLGHIVSEDHKKKLSLRIGPLNPAFGIRWKHKKETLARISASKIGKNHTNETKEKLASINAKSWIIIDPDGNCHEVKNLKEFCQKNNLLYNKMQSVAYGKRLHHKKWKCSQFN